MSRPFNPVRPDEVLSRVVVMGMEKEDVIGIELARESC